LRQVAALIRNELRRPSDFIARYGGEEFVAVLSDVDRPGALIVAEKIRAAVENGKIAHSPRALHPYVTLSLGVCSMTATRQTRVAEIMEPADHALYRAKEAGRNCFMVADQDSPVGDASAAT
jgi:diguanylate cyclase (GGDEF)-like protein